MPILVRSSHDKLTFIHLLLQQKPGWYKRKSEIFQLIGKLLGKNIDEAAQMNAQNKVLEWIARSALDIEDYAESYESCLAILLAYESGIPPSVFDLLLLILSFDHFADFQAKKQLLILAMRRANESQMPFLLSMSQEVLSSAACNEHMDLDVLKPSFELDGIQLSPFMLPEGIQDHTLPSISHIAALDGIIPGRRYNILQAYIRLDCNLAFSCTLGDNFKQNDLEEIYNSAEDIDFEFASCLCAFRAAMLEFKTDGADRLETTTDDILMQKGAEKKIEEAIKLEELSIRFKRRREDRNTAILRDAICQQDGIDQSRMGDKKYFQYALHRYVCSEEVSRLEDAIKVAAVEDVEPAGVICSHVAWAILDSNISSKLLIERLELLLNRHHEYCTEIMACIVDIHNVVIQDRVKNLVACYLALKKVNSVSEIIVTKFNLECC